MKKIIVSTAAVLGVVIILVSVKYFSDKSYMYNAEYVQCGTVKTSWMGNTTYDSQNLKAYTCFKEHFKDCSSAQMVHKSGGMEGEITSSIYTLSKQNDVCVIKTFIDHSGGLTSGSGYNLKRICTSLNDTTQGVDYDSCKEVLF